MIGARRKRRAIEDIDKDRIAWLHTLPCSVPWCDDLDITVHHAGEHGMGQRPPDQTGIPLCRGHHQNLSDSAESLGKHFWGWHGLNLSSLLSMYNVWYQCGLRDASPDAGEWQQRIAYFSNDLRYRYRLWRRFRWVRHPRVLNFIMLNPSTADDEFNDPTVERCERRARMWGYDGLVVTNIFAYRSTDPRELLRCENPEGFMQGLANILSVAGSADRVICAWGKQAPSVSLPRGAFIESQLRAKKIPLYCLKTTQDGVPCHPLYLSYDLKPIRWEPV